MSVIKLEEQFFFNSVYDFVKDFTLEEEFKEKYGVSLDEWEHEKTDEEVIRELLEREPENWLYMYQDHPDGFYVWQHEFDDELVCGHCGAEFRLETIDGGAYDNQSVECLYCPYCKSIL